MRKFLPFLLLSLCARPASATWSVVQSSCTGTPTTDACTGVSTCTKSGLTSITAGNTLVISALLDAVTVVTISSMTNETIVAPAGAKLQVSGHGVALGYVLSATGGWTSTQVTLSSTNTWNVCVSEYHSTTGSAALDTGGSSGVCTSTITSAAPVSCALTVSGSNLVIATGLGWGGSVTGVNSPYTNFVEPNGNGIATNASTVSGTGAVWTPTTSNSGVSASLAIKEAAGGGAATGENRRQRMERLEE